MNIDEIRRLHYKQEWKEDGVAEAIEQSRLKNVEMVIKLLNKKFKNVDGDVIERIKVLSSDSLNLIIEDILDIESIEDLKKVWD